MKTERLNIRSLLYKILVKFTMIWCSVMLSCEYNTNSKHRSATPMETTHQKNKQNPQKKLIKPLGLVFGEDTRESFKDDSTLSQIIGYLTNGYTNCSGFFTGSLEVTTAVHCTPIFQENMPSNWEFKTISGNKFKIVGVVNKWTRADVVTLKVEAIDSNQVASSGFFEVASMDYTPTTETQLISYHKETNEFLVSKGNGFTSIDYGGFFLHDLDTSPGSSGSAVIQNGKIVGIHIGYLAGTDETDPDEPQHFASNLGVEIMKTDTADIGPIFRYFISESWFSEAVESGSISPITQGITDNTKTLSSWKNFEEAINRVSVEEMERIAGNTFNYVGSEWSNFGDWAKGGCDGDYKNVFPSKADRENLEKACEKIVTAIFDCSDPSLAFDIIQDNWNLVKSSANASGTYDYAFLTLKFLEHGFIGMGLNQMVVWASECLVGWSIPSERIASSFPNLQESTKQNIFKKIVEMESTLINEDYGRKQKSPPMVYGICSGLIADKKGPIRIPNQKTRWNFDWEDIHSQNLFYSEIIPPLAEEVGMKDLPWCAVGDSIKFTGLYLHTERFSILEKGIRLSFGNNGQPHRSFYHRRITETRGEFLRSYSRDMTLGLYSYFLGTGDTETAAKYRGYETSHNYWTCDKNMNLKYGDNSCLIPFFVRNHGSRVYRSIKLGGYNRIPKMIENYIDEEIARQTFGLPPTKFIDASWGSLKIVVGFPKISDLAKELREEFERGFVKHLAVMTIFQEAMIERSVTRRTAQAASEAARLNPKNLFFQYVDAVVNGANADRFEAITSELIDKMNNWKTMMENENPPSLGKEWHFQRNYEENRLAYEKPVGLDLVFLAKLMMGKSELESRRRNYLGIGGSENLGVDLATATLFSERYRTLSSRQPSKDDLKGMIDQYNSLNGLLPHQIFRELDKKLEGQLGLVYDQESGCVKDFKLIDHHGITIPKRECI